MIKATIIVLGKYKESGYIQLEKEFLKRLSPFGKIKVIELPEESYTDKDDFEQVKQKEAQKILKVLPKGGIVILMQEKGTLYNSVEYAKVLERLSSLGHELVFVLGSGIGLHNSLQEVANYSHSLSKLTFPHNLARIILLEQIYRAGTIIAKKNYHK